MKFVDNIMDLIMPTFVLVMVVMVFVPGCIGMIIILLALAFHFMKKGWEYISARLSQANNPGQPTTSTTIESPHKQKKSH